MLLYGETGVGKSKLACLIHERSAWAGGPFVHVNCASIPEHLFEREMFGNVRGAFTDARDSRPGLVEAADGGTLFLDEVGELPLSVQPKLLHVLEERMVRRLGATQAVPACFRLMAATNRDLEDMVRTGCFREDLYYRCAVLEHRIPSLRERRGELEAIIAFLQARAECDLARTEVSPGAIGLLRDHVWRGNLRELDNALRQAAVYADGGPILPHHLPERIRRRRRSPAAQRRGSVSAYVAPGTPEEEATLIRDALHAERGNRTRAARHLGMSRATLWVKMQKYASLLGGDGAGGSSME